MLRDHIRKLGKVITPQHVKLGIPQEYLVEAPWWFAQQQILQISAYKTAREKVRCVTRCIMSIMNLLSMTSRRTPAADDLTPVLIFVLIKVTITQSKLAKHQKTIAYLLVGKSPVSTVDDPIRELLPGRENGGTGSLLLDAVLCRRAVHQDHGGLWGVGGGEMLLGFYTTTKDLFCIHTGRFRCLLHV